MTHRLIFMGSDPIALPGLEAIRSGKCGSIEILAVYTQPDRARGRGKKLAPNEIKSWALSHDLPVFQPEKLDVESRLKIEALKPDSILVMAYGHMLSEALIAVPRLGAWNLHTSLLPKYRGASPIQSAVVNGDSETGVSFMRLVKEMDAGPILDVEKVGIDEFDTALAVENKLAAVCPALLERCLPLVHSGEAKPSAQDDAAASYVRKLDKSDGEMDFRVAAPALARRINGLYPWPGARFSFSNVAIKVGQVFVSSEPGSGLPGEVLGMEEDGLLVACSEGAVVFKQLQRPGGRLMSAEEFLRGFPLPFGIVLESRPMMPLVKEAR